MVPTLPLPDAEVQADQVLEVLAQLHAHCPDEPFEALVGGTVVLVCSIWAPETPEELLRLHQLTVKLGEEVIRRAPPRARGGLTPRRFARRLLGDEKPTSLRTTRALCSRRRLLPASSARALTRWCRAPRGGVERERDDSAGRTGGRESVPAAARTATARPQLRF